MRFRKRLERNRHPEVRALRCTCTAGRASKDGSRAVLILRGAQERAPTGERNCVHPGDDGDSAGTLSYDLHLARDERVGHPLLANAGAGAVTADEADIVAERQQLLLD